MEPITWSAWGASSCASAGPVSTPTTSPAPAARPAPRSCRLSPIIATCWGATPVAAAKASTIPGPGFSPWPLSYPAMKSKRSSAPSIVMWARAARSESWVATPSAMPRARNPSSSPGRSGAAAVGASSTAAAARSSISAAMSSAWRPGRCGAHRAATSAVEPETTGEPARKRRVSGSSPTRSPSRRRSARSWGATAAIDSSTKPRQVASKSSSVPSLSKRIPRIMRPSPAAACAPCSDLVSSGRRRAGKAAPDRPPSRGG